MDEIFDSTVERSLAELNKRIADGIQDVVVLESTYMNQGMGKTFEQAVRAGQSHLEDPAKYHFLVDVRRGHYIGITPMPVKSVEGGETLIIDYGYARDVQEISSVKKTIEEHFLDTSKKEAVTKSTIWMRNLLDLTKRNALISFRPSVKNIQLYTNDISHCGFGRAERSGFQSAICSDRSIQRKELCLELHSNKTSRRVVLEKFDQVLNKTSKYNGSEFERKSKRLHRI